MPRGPKPIGDKAMTPTERSRRFRERHRRVAVKKLAPAVAAAADVDPLDVLRSIAGDSGAPAAARVAACRTLVQHETHSAGPATRKLDEMAIQFLRRVN